MYLVVLNKRHNLGQQRNKICAITEREMIAIAVILQRARNKLLRCNCPQQGIVCSYRQIKYRSVT